MSDTLERPTERVESPVKVRREPIRIEMPPRRRLTRWLAWLAVVAVIAVGAGFGIAYLIGPGEVEYTAEFQQMLDDIAASFEGDLVNTLQPAPSIPSWEGETDVFAVTWPAGYTLDWVGYTYITDIDSSIWLEIEQRRSALLERLETVAESYAGDLSD